MQSLLALQSGQLKGSVSLKLSENLTEFPIEIFDLADTLEVLDLSFNKLSTLPADFGRLKKLKIFFCSENLFTVMPEQLADCPLLDIVGFKSNLITSVPAKSLNTNLRWLILTNNNVAELPKEIGLCTRLQKLMLSGNRLSTLPEELSNCQHLSLLRIAANKLHELPQWITQLPKLSWIAFSGNNFSKTPAVETLSLINWHDLEISHLLGEGASGVISKANRTIGDETQEVAVKIFKGNVTSDGLPEDEMTAYIAAGYHPGLVNLIGQIAHHPDEKKGLVMDLIPLHFYNLGNPPSLESCTRDVFPPDRKLSEKQIIGIAKTIASLSAQLHEAGIMHGDLYAHNTLVDDEGSTLFGDFGAASFYDNTAKTAAALERIEVSAYGYLLDDLLSLKDEGVSEEVYKSISQLRDFCLDTIALKRPGFKDLVEALAGI
ncbi:leucine-rich repeat-containing protein kinase family protein [Pedobacter sp. PF22-3]|uniref:leucine-rich repeat-containing protein kinase family protein n=1 Tax=Pedobacter sp. PF22-3 TaxID=2994467 RepID=UPI0022469BF4|nr:leucine-rich repeat-containing protein kinase family protein [Pedobacter sp. PF22-3]MCX2494333.1 leucine-rich repeat-containing protein kinase family protein [Pedobacter sp. PF22-3]